MKVEKTVMFGHPAINRAQVHRAPSVSIPCAAPTETQASHRSDRIYARLPPSLPCGPNFKFLERFRPPGPGRPGIFYDFSTFLRKSLHRQDRFCWKNHNQLAHKRLTK